MQKNTVVILVIVAAVLLLPVIGNASTVKNPVIMNAEANFPLNATQLDSLTAIYAAWQQYGDGDNRKLAYCIATAWHESRLKPIKEIKAAEGSYVWENYQKNYWPSGYYGRGFVQITWRNNYEKLGNRLGIDLVNNPDWALNPQVAAQILVLGMMEGLFTGKKLGQYINDGQTDYYAARATVGAKIVAGVDTAALIQDHTSKLI